MLLLSFTSDPHFLSLQPPALATPAVCGTAAQMFFGIFNIVPNLLTYVASVCSQRTHSYHQLQRPVWS